MFREEFLAVYNKVHDVLLTIGTMCFGVCFLKIFGEQIPDVLVFASILLFALIFTGLSCFDTMIDSYEEEFYDNKN